MGNTLAFGGILTKTKAMSRHLVTHQEYQKIAELDSIADLIQFLRTKPSYEQIFKDMNESTIHRGQIEQLIKVSLLMDYRKLYTFADGEQRVFLDICFFRYEVNILKDCLELIYNQKKTLYLANFKPFFEKHSDLNITELADCQSIDDFISKLSSSKYYSLLSNLHNSNDKISLSDYEIQLDVFYYQRIWKMISNSFKGREKKRMIILFGTQIDMLNILWVYRSKKFYHVDAKEIYLTIIPIHFHLHKEQLVKLVEAPGLSEFLQILSSTYYSFFVEENSGRAFESIYSNVVDQLYKKQIAGSSHSMLSILYYLHLKEQELERVTTALECIRYNLEPSEALKYIYNI